MARTIKEIYDEMVTEKQTMANLVLLQPNIDSSQQLLTDLTSASKVAIWRLCFFVMAVGIWSHEKLFDDFKFWIENRALEIQVGTLPWYQKKALEFQYGDALVFSDDQYKYATVNESARIVKLASVNEVGGNIIVKVAKLDTNDNPIPLTIPELSALDAYMFKVKFAGVKVINVSRTADLLKTYFKIYYDPLVLSSTGELISTPGVFPVHDAINSYIKNLPFNGVYSTTELTDLIQQAQGVINPVHEETYSKYGSFAYTPLIDYYQPNAGYLAIDPAFDLSTTITYISAS